jgi:DNA-directed RNA polymerase specialized sigma subunit
MEYSNREIPFDMDTLMMLLPSRQPDNDWQALMEAPPYVEPVSPSNTVDTLGDIIINCIDQLNAQDKFIIEAINYEQVTFVELGSRLGVSNVHAWRLKNAAYDRLKDMLLEEELIRSLLGMNDG